MAFAGPAPYVFTTNRIEGYSSDNFFTGPTVESLGLSTTTRTSFGCFISLLKFISPGTTASPSSNAGIITEMLAVAVKLNPSG
jgi:hypothetical protein